MKPRILPKLTLLLLAGTTLYGEPSEELSPTSNNRQIQVIPAPGEVKIDGKENDWDLSAGIWSYNDPTLVDKYSVWTHLMWDEKGVYVLCRYHDISPMKNATRGEDFMLSWKADALQARVILDDRTDEEHQMHINLFYSSAENQPYMIVKHGGFKSKPPFDATGPDRPEQLEKYGTTMEKHGGKIAFQPWEDGKGYTLEAFWPWSYLRTSGKPLKAGESFTFGVESMWGNSDGTNLLHRLADNLKSDQVNRIFFFRARDGWGRAVLSDKGNLSITAEQKKLQEARLRQFVNYDTHGSIPISYQLEGDREVTIAIDNAKGQRVRNLFGQFPRTKGSVKDLWDGLDDEGKPVEPGEYTVTVVDHEPFRLQFVNSIYNAATPPWQTDVSRKSWGSNHGHPMTAATRGDTILIGATGTEGTSGLMSVTPDGIIKWNDSYELQDVTLDDEYVYAFSNDSWIKQVVVRRYRLKDGELLLFEDEAKSPNAVLPVDREKSTDGTIAVSGEKIFVLIKGGNFFRLHGKTGVVESEKTPPEGLVALDDRDGIIRGIFTDGSVYELGPDGEKGKLVVKLANLNSPARFAISQDGKRIAVSDRGTNQVFIFGMDGKLLHTLGKPYAAVDGMRPGGKFIETDFIDPNGLDFDAQGRLWVAEAEGTCRRVTCWSPEGKLVDQFWGAADYGAMAGFPITHDSTRFIAHGVEFKLDPNPDVMNRPSQEQPLVFHPALAGNTRGIVYRYKGNEYAVSVPGYNKQDFVVIAKRDKDGVFIPVVRIDYPEHRGQKIIETGRVWTDLNENGREDEGEVFEGFQGRRHYWSNGWMRPDLTFITPDQNLYPLQKLTEGGVPVYDFSNPQKPKNSFTPDFNSNRSGTVMLDNAGNLSDGINYATVDGRTGSYPNPYGRHDAPAARRGLLIAPFRTNGIVEDVPAIGSMTAIGGDRGEWFLMSMDGLYLSNLLQDIKGDVTLDDNFVGAESFGGYIWRDEKGRILVQLGGASYRLMELLGTETLRKNVQKIQVSAAQVAEGVKQAEARAAAQPKEPETLTVARVSRLPAEAPNADIRSGASLIAGAETARIQEQGDASRWFRVALAQNGRELAVAWQVNDSSPWKNGEKNLTHAFIGGDAVDLQLDIPGRGPVRILVVPHNGKNTAIYWQKTAQEKQNPTTYAVANNDANAQTFDVVRALDKAKISVSQGMLGYTVLLTVPLEELGINPKEIEKIRGIAGVIFSDPSGTNRTSRLYWHSKSTGLVSDVPSESRLNPESWGPIEFAK